MANRDKTTPGKAEPSLNEWIAGGAKSPDDFDSETPDAQGKADKARTSGATRKDKDSAGKG